MRATLIPFPGTGTAPLGSLTVHLERQAQRMWVRFVAEGAVGHVVWPGPAEPVRADHLWQRSCFEVFVQTTGGYREFNLSPSGQWASYRFDGYRQGREDAVEVVAVAPLDLADDMLALEAHLDLPSPTGRLGLSAVIETVDGAKTYWALAHPSDKPDFHHPDSFILGPAMKFGIDRLISDPELRAALDGKRVALVAHPASVTADLTHSIDALIASGVRISAALGPQHGMKGDLQDNMMESPDETDPVHGFPVFSLYGEVRRPSGQMMSTFDVVLIDLQDLGCRIYTFITTLLYMLEACAAEGKEVWVLDRPNPAGRPVEGLTLRPGWESFVGAGPIPMRHGLTLGELGHWFIDHFKLDVRYRVIAMEGYDIDAGPGHGWPLGERSWINPSPNAQNLSMARAYAGTVMLEGATLSEGRGTTRPLELFGAPDIDARAVIAEMQALAPEWLKGCRLRDMWFEPTFHKHVGTLCNGIQIHIDDPAYDHAAFKPWRVQALGFKAIRRLYPDYDLWRDFPYEYAFGKLPIDVINGGPALREWVDDPAATPADLDAITGPDEAAWIKARRPFLLY